MRRKPVRSSSHWSRFLIVVDRFTEAGRNVKQGVLRVDNLRGQAKGEFLIPHFHPGLAGSFIFYDSALQRIEVPRRRVLVARPRVLPLLSGQGPSSFVARADEALL